jgi:hypothetical protein
MKTMFAPVTWSRRSFAKLVPLLLVSMPFIRHVVEAQTNDKSKEAPGRTPSPQTAPKITPLALAYAEVAKVRFGAMIDAEQIDLVKENLNNYVQSADRLKKYPLKNDMGI